MNENWYSLDIDQAFQKLETSRQGLNEAEAASRLEKYGPNELQEKKKKTRLQIFFSQFRDFMILVLVGAAVISGIVGDPKDAIVIAIIVLINAVVGFIQEYRAEKAMEALKKMSATDAKLKRDNKIIKVPVSELVPGDIVLLEAGDMVPADLRLTDVHALKIEEASLTGESYPVEKQIEPLSNEDVPLGDRTNMAYKATMVTYGRGEGVVVATGMNTEIGSIAQMLQGAEAMTPLQKRLEEFSKKLSYIVLAICLLLLIMGLLRGENWANMLLVAISLAVAAIPEALPAVITVSLALGARKLVRKNALIRRLHAVETLGSVTFICTDKTGTLTENRMTVKETWVPEANGTDQLQGENLLLFCMIQNQDTKQEKEGKISGDPTEVALYEYAVHHDNFQQEWLQVERIYEMPFDSDRKMMTTVHPFDDRFIVITKGALESIVDHCIETNREQAEAASSAMAEKGMRVLAYAYKLIEHQPDDSENESLENELHFAGLAGMIDPPREEAKKAVAECIGAGIVPVMITGDHPVTAKAIAREIGILREENDRVVTGIELSKMPEEQFASEIEKIKVYARVNPEQKLQIVKTLQSRQHFVSMTGDGVNDAPALKQANIGVAMGITGTDVSKEASDMILLDDNFATIVRAVKEGRRIFDNIRKFIRYIMTGNSSEIWTIMLAPLFGLPIPLLPIHILWVNLVTDGLPALALANEPAEKNIMQRPPRRSSETVFAQGLGWHVLWVGLLMGGLCLVIQYWAIDLGKTHWQTMVFTTLCFSQMAHVLAIRKERSSFFSGNPFSNLFLLGSVLLTFLLQLAIIYVPQMNEIFSTAPLNMKELLICIGAGAVVFTAVEIEKVVRR